MKTRFFKIHRVVLGICAIILASCGNESSQDADTSLEPPEVRSLADEPAAQGNENRAATKPLEQPVKNVPKPLPIRLDNSRIFVSKTASGADNGSSWTDAYNDLNDALNRAESGSEVWVAVGTYKPHKSDRSVSFELKAGVSLLGGFKGNESATSQRDWKANRTVLSGDLAGNDSKGQKNDENSIHVVTCTFRKSTEAVLDGFMVTGGNANMKTPYSSRSGGGIYGSGAGLSVKNCFILENSALEKGGGIFLERATGKIIDCVFLRNKANDGGGCYASYTTLGTIESSRFSDNSARSNGGGLLASDTIVKSCQFKTNTADDGGAIYADNSRTKFTVEDTLFEENSANDDGGAIATWVSTALEIKSCRFSKNRARVEGGAVNARGEVLIEDCKFLHNAAKQGGSAFDFFSSQNKLVIRRSNFESNTKDAVSISSCKNALVEDCTFTKNSLGAFSAWEANVKLVRLTFTDNQNDDGYGGAISTSYCELAIDSCKFSGNSAKDRGGAAFVKGKEGRSLSVKECTFSNNTCGTGFGGAIYASFFDKATFTTCQFTKNSCGGGGALYLSIKETRLKSCVFKGNKARCGGAIYSNEKPKMTACTFSGNQAEEDKDVHVL